MPDIKLTKKELIDLWGGLHAVGNLSGSRFVYVIARNISLLKDEVEALRIARQPKKEYAKYDKARIELAKKFATKDDKGNPRTYTEMDGSVKFVIEDMAAFDKEVEKLKKKHNDVVKEREDQLKDFDKLLEDEIEILLLGLQEEDLPEGITAHQLSGIFPLMMDVEEVN